MLMCHISPGLIARVTDSSLSEHSSHYGSPVPLFETHSLLINYQAQIFQMSFIDSTNSIICISIYMNTDKKIKITELNHKI